MQLETKLCLHTSQHLKSLIHQVPHKWTEVFITTNALVFNLKENSIHPLDASLTCPALIGHVPLHF